MRLFRSLHLFRSLQWIPFLLILLVAISAPTIAQGTGATVQAEIIISPDPLVAGETVARVDILLHGNSTSCFIETPRPVDVVLVLDANESMRGEAMTQMVQGAKNFVDTLNFEFLPLRGGDQVGFVTFSDTAYQAGQLTQDRVAIEAVLDTIAVGGEATLAQAVRQATFILTNVDTANIAGEAAKIMLIITDGDTTSTDLREAASQARSAGARLIILGLGPAVDEALSREITGDDGEYYAIATAADLPGELVRIGTTIHPTIAARNIEVSFDLNEAAFELDPISINPPATSGGSDPIHWVRGWLFNGQTATFTFNARSLQNGATSAGQLTVRYAHCGDEASPMEFSISPPIVNAVPPTPLPSETPTDLPPATLTPRPTPAPTLPGAVDEAATGGLIPASGSLGVFSGLRLCADNWGIVVYVLAAILILLGLLAFWWLWNKKKAQEKRWREDPNHAKPMTWACLLARLAFIWYLLFLVFLFLLPPMSSFCERGESVYFWRQDGVSDTTGIFFSPPSNSDAISLNNMNEDGCVGCHTVSSAGQYVAGVQGVPPNTLRIFTLSGEEVAIPDIDTNYASFSPDGRFVVIATVHGDEPDLVILDIDTGAITPLAGANQPNVAETMPFWGPNGRIAFVRTTNMDSVRYGGLNITAPVDIYTIPETGGVAEPLMGASGGGFNYYPAYSPDGVWLAFTYHNNERTYGDSEADIYIVPANGGDAIRLAANDVNGVRPLDSSNSWASWSKDGHQLAFNSRRNDQNFDIFVTDIDASGNSSEAIPLSGAATPGIFEHTPFWGKTANEVDIIGQWIASLPWLLPLPLLLFLAWWACRRKKVMPQPEPYRTPPLPGPIEPPPPPPPPPDDPMVVLWKPRPALIIGLGAAGRWVLTHIKKNMLDANLGKMPDDVKLLCVYVGKKDRMPDVTFAGVELADNELIEISDDLDSLLRNRNLRNDPAYAVWLSDIAPTLLGQGAMAVNLNSGANGSRPLARAGFINHLRKDEPGFYDALKAAIPSCLDNNNLSTLIVGDTSGDIESAILLDAALLTRIIAKQQGAGIDAITAHMVLKKENDMDKANTSATLREIRRFQMAQARPFPLYYNVPNAPELDCVCDWLPLDDLVMYETNHYLQDHQGRVRDTKPQWALYAAMADATTMWLDEATQRGNQAQFTAEEKETMLARIRETERVHVATEGVYQYRLPFVDIIDRMRIQFMETILRYVVPQKPDDTVTPEIRAKNILDGTFNVEPQAASISQMMPVMKACLTGQSTEAIASLLDRMPNLNQAALRDTMQQRWHNTLKILLNGENGEQNVPRKRGMKFNYTLQVLNALTPKINQIGQALEDVVPKKREANKDILLTVLEQLNAQVATAKQALTEQAHLLSSKEMDQPKSLYEQVLDRRSQLQALSDETSQLAIVREYLWHLDPETKQDPIDKAWYDKYLRPHLDDMLKLFYWEVTGNGEPRFTLAKPNNNNVQLSTSTLMTFYEDIFNQISSYCAEIQRKESLETLLDSTRLSEDAVSVTTQNLVQRSKLPLNFRKSEASMAIQPSQTLGANAKIQQVTGLERLRDILKTRHSDLDTLFLLENNDPYSLSLKQRVAVISELDLPLDDQVYKTQNGFFDPRYYTPREAILTAVYQAEAGALDLERQRGIILQRTPDYLHPIVVTALSDMKRARLFALILAANEISMSMVRNEPQIRVRTRETRNLELILPVTLGRDMPLIAQALLAFTADGGLPADQRQLSDEVLDAIETRYEGDPKVQERWNAWLKGEWNRLLADTPDYQYKMVEEIVDSLRLLVIRKRNELADSGGTQ